MEDSPPLILPEELKTCYDIHAAGESCPSAILVTAVETSFASSSFAPYHRAGVVVEVELKLAGIGAVLGKGRFAVVKAGTCKKTGGAVAIKIIDKDRCKIGDHVSSFCSALHHRTFLRPRIAWVLHARHHHTRQSSAPILSGTATFPPRDLNMSGSACRVTRGWPH